MSTLSPTSVLCYRSATVCPLQDPFFCSWSGGKDSALALHKALMSGKNATLLTMMIENGLRSRSHGIPKAVLQAQAKCLNLPIRFCATSWNSYTANFSQELRLFKEEGIDHGIFGDIDLEEHRKWVETVCSEQKITPWLPLWQKTRAALLNELFTLGFRAEIIAVKANVLPPHFLGKILTPELIQEFEKLQIDLCGEKGEYHTIVTDGPIFHSPLSLAHGEQVLKDGYWFSDVSHQPLEGI